MPAASKVLSIRAAALEVRSQGAMSPSMVYPIVSGSAGGGGASGNA